jgi:Family of unknown function (DUF5522)/Cysteine-rich CWC
MFDSQMKNCPRCNVVFECKVGDITNCQCGEVNISSEARKFLSKTTYDCLCQNCLQHFEQLINKANMHPTSFANQKEPLVEGLHYYVENGAWVFTELHHMQRGYCCKNACRHCVYGFERKV